MALPLELTAEQATAIRRAVVVLALWQTRHAEIAGGDAWEAIARELAVETPEREAIELYEQARGHFSFFDRRAANWLFGHLVAAIVDREGDFAVVAPAAAWAIHALNAARAP